MFPNKSNKRGKVPLLPIGKDIVIRGSNFSAKELATVTEDPRLYLQFSQKSLSWLAFRYLRINNEILYCPLILFSKAIEEKYAYTYSSFVTLCQLMHEVGHLTWHWDALIPPMSNANTSLRIVRKATTDMEIEAWNFARELAIAFQEHKFLSYDQLQMIDKIISDSLALIR